MGSVCSFREYRYILLFLVKHSQRLVHPRQVRILPVYGYASCVPKEEAESLLFESVLCCEIMNAVLPEYCVDYRAVQMTCVVDYKD